MYKLQPLKLSPIESKLVHEQLLEIFMPFIESHTLAQLQDLGGDYESIIKKLSGVDPLIAYYLKGRVHVFQHVNQFMERYSTDVLERNLAGEMIGGAKTIVSKFTQNMIYKEALDSIKDQAISLASQINWRTRREVKRLFSPRTEEENKQEEKEIQEMVKKMVLALEQYDFGNYQGN